MSLVLPTQLANMLSELGFLWINSDEDGLFKMGDTWGTKGTQVKDPAANADVHANQVLTNQSGQGVEQFGAKWNAQNAPNKNLFSGGTGAAIIGLGLKVCAMIVKVLKIVVIAQLISLLVQIIAAMYASFVTGGGSLAWIPVKKKITQMMINLGISGAMNAVMG